MFASKVLTFMGLTSLVSAHMRLYEPAPFNASNNPHRTTAPDTELLFPYNCCGDVTPFPCRGYLSLLGTPDGAPTATWPAGSKQFWSIDGTEQYGGNHYGGSCQVGFSIDQGKTFRVASSYEGNCPHRNGGQSNLNQKFNFTVPEDLPTGDVLFAWTWFNREQEFFMNCAAVTIANKVANVGSGAGSSSASSSVKSSSSLSIKAASSVATSSTATRGAMMTKSTTSSLSSTKTSSSTAAASSSAVPAGTHEIHGCSCSCTSYTTKNDGSVALNNCTCVCPNTPSAKHKRHPLHKFTLPSSNTNAAGTTNLKDNTVTSPQLNTKGKLANIGILSLDEIAEAEKASSKVVQQRDVAVAFNSRPKMFIANINNGCKTPLTTAELQFPQPGPDLYMGDGEYPLALPSGTCAA